MIIHSTNPWIIIGSDTGILHILDISPLKQAKVSAPRQISYINIFNTIPKIVTTDSAIEIITSSPFWKLGMENPNKIYDEQVKEDVDNTTTNISNSIMTISLNSKLHLLITTRTQIIELDASNAIIAKIKFEDTIEDFKSDVMIVQPNTNGDFDLVSLNQIAGTLFHMKLTSITNDIQSRNFEKIESLEDLINSVLGEDNIWNNNIVESCLKGFMNAHIRTLNDLVKHKFDEFEWMPVKFRSVIVDYIQCKSQEDNQIQSFLTNNCSTIQKTSILFQAKALATNTKILTSTPTKLKAQAQGLKQPIALHNTIKSSGYAKSLISKMHSLPKKVIPKLNKLTRVLNSDLDQRYQTLFIPKLVLQPNQMNLNHSESITCMKFSKDGKYLVTGSADKTFRLQTLLKNKMYSTKEYSGHDGTITDINLSKNQYSNYGPLVLSASNDSTVKLWSSNSSDKPLTTISDKLFINGISNTQFYYQDKFILLSNKNNLYAYTYSFEKTEKGNIKPIIPTNKTKCVATIPLTCNSITAFKAFNQHQSNLVLIAGSDKSLLLYDFNGSKFISTILNAYTKTMQDIQVGDYDYTPSPFECLFSTSSVGCIMTWDVRQMKRAVMSIGTVNRAGNVNHCFSPCGRYVLSGADDGFGYFYDIRMGGVVDRIRGGNETIGCVGMHPFEPRVCLGGQGGSVYVY